MPSARELITLLDYGSANENATVSSIDTTYFPAPSRNGYWSSSGYGGSYWVIDFWGSSPQIEVVVALTTITLFIPCIANFFMILKERGWKTGVAMLAFILPFAFGVGAAVNQLMRLAH